MTVEKLRLEYVPLSQCRLWDKNPKKHNIGEIADSIMEYGFKDPPKYEPTLNNGKGGFAEGNGRTETLIFLKKQGRLPKGIVEDESGEWLIPVLFGVDSKSEEAAEAYAVDHNNLTMSGGDFTQFDMAKLWEQGQYLELLNRLGEENTLPFSVTGDSLDELNYWLTGEGASRNGNDEDDEEDEEQIGESFWPTLKMEISPENLNRWRAMQKELSLSDNELINKILQDEGF